MKTIILPLIITLLGVAALLLVHAIQKPKPKKWIIVVDDEGRFSFTVWDGTVWRHGLYATRSQAEAEMAKTLQWYKDYESGELRKRRDKEEVKRNQRFKPLT